MATVAIIETNVVRIVSATVQAQVAVRVVVSIWLTEFSTT
jgi:hypothetical protein